VGNIRAAAIAAAAAFVLSSLIGLFSGAGFPALIVRALIFGGLFFFISNFCTLMVRRFLPELLTVGDTVETAFSEPPGSRVDITEGDAEFPELGNGDPDAAPAVEPELALPSIEENAGSLGLDQDMQDDYTSTGGAAPDTAAPGTPAPVLARGAEEHKFAVAAPVFAAANAGTGALEGRIRESDPKDMAEGIRTLLHKEEP